MLKRGSTYLIQSLTTRNLTTNSLLNQSSKIANVAKSNFLVPRHHIKPTMHKRTNFVPVLYPNKTGDAISSVLCLVGTFYVGYQFFKHRMEDKKNKKLLEEQDRLKKGPNPGL